MNAQPTKPSGIPWLGDIPAHWEVKRADGVLQEDRTMIGPAIFIGRNIFHYSIPSIQESGDGAVEEGETIASAKTRITKEVLLVSKLNPRKGTVLIGRPREEMTVCSGEFVPLIPLSCDLGYAEYTYKSEQVRQQLDASVHSVTRSHQRASSEEITKVMWAWPPLPEQRAIAAFLDERTARIDGLIARKQRLVALLREKRQALITHAVTRGLDAKVKLKESGVPWLGMVPEHWGVKRIGHLCTVVRGSTPRPAGDERYFNGSAMPWITVSEITGAKGRYISSTETSLTEEGVPFSRIVEPGTLLLSNSGATLGVPRVTGIRGCINDGCAAFLNLSEALDQDFLHYFLDNHTSIYRAETQGSGQPNLNTDLIGSTRMALPPLEVTIANYLNKQCDHHDALIAKVEAAVLRLVEYRVALISAAVTGKVRVG
ncbi:MAG: restriction endonuclease subunit S [Flavobacteriales bacterium]